MTRQFLHANLAAVVALLCATTAVAQPVFTQHVPADAVVVVSWQGTEEAGEAYAQSSFKAFLDETQLPSRFGRVFGQLVEQAGPDPDTEVLGSFFRDVMPAAIARPWVFYVGPLVLDDRGRDPRPSLGFLIDPGDGEAGRAIERWLIEQFEKVEDQPGAQLIEYGDLLGIVLGRPFLNPDDPDTPAAIKGQDRFNDIIAGLGEAPMLVAYIDADAGRDMILEAMLLEEDQAAHDTANRVMSALGLDKLHRIALTGSFDQRDWVQRLFIDAPAPRTGIPALLAGQPMDEDTLAALPDSATWFRSMHLDPAGVLGLIRDAMDATGDERTILDFEQGLKEGSEAVGFDIERDLLDPAGPRWTIYSEPGFGSIAGFYPGVALMHEPDDPAKIDASLLKFKDYLNAQMQNQGAPFQIASMEMGELTIHSFAFPMAQPGWAIQDGTMYAAASAMAITAAHTAKAGDGPKLIDSDAYQAVRKRLRQLAGAPDAEPTSLMYADLPKTSMPMYQSYVAMVGMMGGVMGRGAGGPVNFNELIPPYNAMQKHLTPAGDVLWSDDAGLHFVSVSPFPGATLLSPDAALSSGVGMPTMMPMMFGVMMPAMGAARSTARQIQTSTQARGIHQGMVVHAQSNDGKMTDDLYELLDNNMFTVEYALSPQSGIKEPADFDRWPKEKQRAWLQRNASFVLVPGLTEDFDTTMPAVIHKPEHSNGRRIAVAFNDGHVQALSIDEAEKIVKEKTGKTIDELIEAVESKAPEGTPDALATIKAEREKLLEEIRARRAEKAGQTP